MKICLVNNLYKPYQKGGAERIVELLNDELKNLGHTVFIVSTRPRTKKSNEELGVYYLMSNYSELNHHSFLYRFFWQLNNLFNLEKYYKFKKIIKEEKPDLIISNNLMGLGLLIPRAIKKSKTKHFHIIHDIQLLHPSGLVYFGKEKIINSFFAKIYQKITNILISNPVIISPSNWLLKLHQQQGLFKKTQNRIISNPVKKNHSIINRGLNNFIFIGQIETHKGVDLFMEAASRFTDYNFIIVGSGSLKITETNNLKFLGKQSPEEVSRLLSDSLAAIIPSRCYENSPTVIYEAAAVNTPVIAANIGGIPELIEKFGGLLFEPDNLDSLVITIEQFLKQGVSLKSPETKSYAKEILSLL